MVVPVLPPLPSSAHPPIDSHPVVHVHESFVHVLELVPSPSTITPLLQLWLMSPCQEIFTDLLTGLASFTQESHEPSFKKNKSSDTLRAVPPMWVPWLMPPAAALEEDWLEDMNLPQLKAVFVSVSLTLKLDYPTHPPHTWWEPIQ